MHDANDRSARFRTQQAPPTQRNHPPALAFAVSTVLINTAASAARHSTGAEDPQSAREGQEGEPGRGGVWTYDGLCHDFLQLGRHLDRLALHGCLFGACVVGGVRCRDGLLSRARTARSIAKLRPREWTLEFPQVRERRLQGKEAAEHSCWAYISERPCALAVPAWQELGKARVAAMRLPRADGFLFFITLRFGVYFCCMFDAVSAVFDIITTATVLAYPDLMRRAQDNDAFHGATGEAGGEIGKRILARAGRATLTLAVPLIYFAFRGAIAARVGHAKDLGDYVGFKAVYMLATCVFQACLHRVWWDGCGMLSGDACLDTKLQLVFLPLVSALPGLYCLWVAWSLLDALNEGSEGSLLQAGYDEYDLQERRVYLERRAAYQAVGATPSVIPEMPAGWSASPIRPLGGRGRGPGSATWFV